MAAGYADKSGVRRLPGPAHFGDLDLYPKLDFGQHRIETVVAGGIAKVGGGRLQPEQGRRARHAAEDLDLELIQGVEGGPPAPHGAPPPLGGVVLTLQSDESIDAADRAKRCGGLRGFRSIACIERKAAGRRAAWRGRSRGLDGGV